MFTAVDVYGLIAWITFTYWQLYPNTDSSYNDWYTEKSKQVACSPPGWLFGVAWSILYALIAASAFLYTRNFEANIYYLAVVILLIVNIALNKFWSVVFFSRNARTGLALLIALMMLASEIAILILMGLSDAWLPFGLFLPYVAWTAYAIYLNWQWYRKGLAYETLPTVASKLEQKRKKMRPEKNSPRERSVRHRLRRPVREENTTNQKKKVIIDIGI